MGPSQRTLKAGPGSSPFPKPHPGPWSKWARKGSEKRPVGGVRAKGRPITQAQTRMQNVGLGRPNSLPESQSEPDPRTAPRIWPEPGCISSYNSHQNSPAQGHLISRSSQRVCRLLPHPRTLRPTGFAISLPPNSPPSQHLKNTNNDTITKQIRKKNKKKMTYYIWE